MKIHIEADLKHADGLVFSREKVEAQLLQRLNDLALVIPATFEGKPVSHDCTCWLINVKVQPPSG